MEAAAISWPIHGPNKCFIGFQSATFIAIRAAQFQAVARGLFAVNCREQQAPNTLQSCCARRKKEPLESTTCIFWSNRQVMGSTPTLGSNLMRVSFLTSTACCSSVHFVTSHNNSEVNSSRGPGNLRSRRVGRFATSFARPSGRGFPKLSLLARRFSVRVAGVWRKPCRES